MQIISNEGKNAKHVMDLKYMKFLRSQLRVINAWPRREFNEHEPRRPYATYYFIVQALVAMICMVLYIFKNIGNLTFFELGHSYITVALNFVHTPRIMLPLYKKYKDICREFVTKIHLFNYKNRSDFAMKIHIKIQKISYGITMYLVCEMICGTVLFNVVPMYRNYKAGMYSTDRPQNSNVTYNHAVYYSLPFDVNSSLKGYIFISIYVWYLSYFASVGICMFDLFLFLMVFHLWGHFKILINNLKAFPRSNESSWYHSKKFSAEESTLVLKVLKECIEYHRMLLNFVGQMSIVFGPILCMYNLFHLTGGCLLLLQCSKMNPEALVQYAPLTIIIFQQLIQMSVIFDLLGTVSEELYDTVYQLPWEYMDRRNRTTVLMILLQVRRPVRVKAIGSFDIGVVTMTAILKGSFSYYTFLRTMAE